MNKAAAEAMVLWRCAVIAVSLMKDGPKKQTFEIRPLGDISELHPSPSALAGEASETTSSFSLVRQ
jgi:hypothetical protein